MAPAISMEMRCSVMAPVSPCWWLCIYANMGISRVVNSSSSCFLFILSLYSPHFCTASPHTWHAAHMKRVQSLLTLSPSLTFSYSSISHHYISSFAVTVFNNYNGLLNYHSLQPTIMCVDLAWKLHKSSIRFRIFQILMWSRHNRKALVSSSRKVSQVQINKPNSHIKRRAKKVVFTTIFGQGLACPDSRSCLTYCNPPSLQPHTSLLASLSPLRPPSLAWLFLIMYLFV